ncbi:LysR family transcriptional regulator [Achromobacter xylosoxidans]
MHSAAGCWNARPPTSNKTEARVRTRGQARPFSWPIEFEFQRELPAYTDQALNRRVPGAQASVQIPAGALPARTGRMPDVVRHTQYAMRLQLPPCQNCTPSCPSRAPDASPRCADGLEMTQGGVSRSIRRLESRLGVILFLRGGRGVTLTEAGRQLFDRVEPSLRVLSDAMMEIDTQASPRSRLTVRSVSTLATRWLIPKLPEFNQQIPNVRVVLQPYAPDDDFLDTQTDCWIVPQ